MKILPFHLRTPSLASSVSAKTNVVSRLKPVHSPGTTQVAASLTNKPLLENTSRGSLHSAVAFQPQTTSVSSPTQIDSELKLLAMAKRETVQRLKEAQAELATLMASTNASPPSDIEINKCFLHALHQEKQATQEAGSLGRIYQTVLDEEVEVQGKQIYESLSQTCQTKLDSLKKEFSEKFQKINNEKSEYIKKIEKSSLSEHEKIIAKDNANIKFREEFDVLHENNAISTSKCWSDYHAITKDLKSSKTNGIYDVASLTNNTPLEIKSGEVTFLKHKLAIIDYCQKTSSLYQQSIWSPSEKTISLLTKQKNTKIGNIDNLTVDELIKLSQALSNVKSAKKSIIKASAIKIGYKYSLVGTPTYLVDRMTVNTFKSSLKTAQENLKTNKKTLHELSPSKKQNLKTVNQVLIEKLLSEERKNDLCDKKINDQLALLTKLPLMSSVRGVDPASGLYHEQQFSKSGTCILHSVNHYMASYANQNDDVFLAFTPKRLELMLNAVHHHQQAELFENLSTALLSGKENKYFSDIFKDQEKGITAINNKYLLHNANYAADYNYEKQDSEITEAVGTSDFNNQGIITTLMNKVYGLNEDISSSQPAITWKMRQGKLENLQNTHSQLRMHYSTPGRETGHAMNFSKGKDGQWYFQDSHFDAPIPCTPVDMINHLNSQDKPDSPLSTISYYGSKISFREHHDIGATASISFFHYS